MSVTVIDRYSDLVEDCIAATNPRIIKKVAKARAEKTTISFKVVFADRKR